MYKEYIEEKQDLKETIGKFLSKSSIIRKLKNDPHRNRIPRFCGMTIHTGIGCPNHCTYCYIQDLGFKFTETIPYSLTGIEMTYALLNNPFFVPGKMGTFLAIGSIADPFYLTCQENTFEYLRNFSKFLKNPTQFSTKMYLSKEKVEKLTEDTYELPLSPLVTIITLKKAKNLEPMAPTPEERFKTISNLRDAGFKPILFLRPIIPGITDLEFENIISGAADAGAVGIVAGTLRISKNILNRLSRSSIDLNFILSRAKRISDNQEYIRASDLKLKALEIAKAEKLIPFKSACCANAYNADVACMNVCFAKNFCSLCPNNCETLKIPKVKHQEVKELVENILKLEVKDIQINAKNIDIFLQRIGKKKKKTLFGKKILFQTILRRKISIK